jgi:hypothetical protein
MASKNWGGVGHSNVKNANTDGTFYRVQHNVGSWILTSVRPVIYVMRAYSTTVNDYVYWQTPDPGQNISGHSITNKTISSILVDYFPQGS